MRNSRKGTKRSNFRTFSRGPKRKVFCTPSRPPLRLVNEESYRLKVVPPTSRVRPSQRLAFTVKEPVAPWLLKLLKGSPGIKLMYSYATPSSYRGSNRPGGSSGVGVGPGKGVALGIAGKAKKSGAGATFTAPLVSELVDAASVPVSIPSSTPWFLCFAKLGSASSTPSTTVRHHLDIMFLP